MLDAAAPLESAHAIVVGRGSLEVLCALIGQGCSAATVMAHGGRLPPERAELVLVPLVASLDEAHHAIAIARRALLPCGRIVLRDPNGTLAARMARMLRAAGFSAVRIRPCQAHDGVDGAIVSADWPMFGLHREAAHV